MEKKLTTDQMKNLLGHVIRTIDRWWVVTTDLKRGFFTKSDMNNLLVTYKDYVEWRYSATVACKDYESIFISLEYENDMDYIRIMFRKMKNGVYTEYDPFCEICDGKTDVVISEQTGFDLDNIIYDVLTGKDFDVLTNTIADTVHRFMDTASVDEEKVGVNMDDVSKTLSSHDIQDCMIKAMRIMLIDRDTVNELTRLLRSKYIADHDLSTIQCKNMLGYVIEAAPKHVVTKIVYDDAFVLCSFTCEPDTHGQDEFIIRYNSCDTGFEYAQGFNILYKNPDFYCFEYAGDGLDTEKVFKPFVNILRNTLNYELYRSLDCFQDTEITAPAGLTTKEVFILDTSYFVIGDIYLLDIDPKYDWSKISSTPVKVPRQVYAICDDVCSTVIDFMIGNIEGRDSLFRIPVHADEIESGLITVKRVLTNESLIQNTDEECYHE